MLLPIQYPFPSTRAELVARFPDISVEIFNEGLGGDAAVSVFRTREVEFQGVRTGSVVSSPCTRRPTTKEMRLTLDMLNSAASTEARVRVESWAKLWAHGVEMDPASATAALLQAPQHAILSALHDESTRT